MNYSIFDMETDGLLDNMTKIHCLCVNKFVDGEEPRQFSLTNYDEIVQFVLNEECLVGHNIIRFDIPALEKFFKIKIPARKVDSLALSWYLYPERLKHGLAEWGQDLGIEKPPIEDWENLDVERYIYRCSEDVKINTKLFNMQMQYLSKIYSTPEQMRRILGYLTFKLECAAEQEEVKWRIDKEKTIKNLAELSVEYEAKQEFLANAMPPKITYKVREKPKVFTKKDGEVSALGLKWLDLLKEQNLPDYYHGSVKIVDEVLRGNPGSTEQIKDWLFSLGWKPQTFKYVRKDYQSEQRAIPQINLIDGSGICPSIKELYEDHPVLQNLESYYLLEHRIGILKGFLESIDDNNFLVANIGGLTNTLRFKHKKPLTNLPTVSRAYGDYIRGVMIAPTDKGTVLCGSDMSSLEDATKQHYMWKYDPEYVKEMQVPGFDPHLDIALQGKMITVEDIPFYKEYERKHRDEPEHVFTEEEVNRYKKLKKIRGNEGKKTNFAAVYGVGVEKLSLTNSWHKDKSAKMLKVYWKRNWSVKEIAKNCIVKTVNGQMWLFNPVSHFWYSLRYEKDRFSTLNQGTGVYCFDTQVKNVRAYSIRMCGQFHDEFVFPLRIENIEKAKRVLDEAIIKTNAELKLNVQLRISKDFGYSYADIH